MSPLFRSCWWPAVRSTVVDTCQAITFVHAFPCKCTAVWCGMLFMHWKVSRWLFLSVQWGSAVQSDICRRRHTLCRQSHWRWHRLTLDRRRRFWHATHDCIAPYVDIILHRGWFWAKSAALGSVRWCCFQILLDGAEPRDAGTTSLSSPVCQRGV